ncbi:PAAR domain-containing protein [Chromobacterium sphagni]|uniref:PAAR domain-containing protein n=1 Tax=Chromobacterium sphagni TaxID=1903179 RepID=UPI001113C16F|nr:PAAR domain-containing protein [Chromobacterium sphagni]
MPSPQITSKAKTSPGKLNTDFKRIIRLVDPTDHCGNITSASSTNAIFGKAAAPAGNSVSYPKQSHVNCATVEGDP